MRDRHTHRAETNPGENEHIVALRGLQALSIPLKRLERGPRGKNSRPVRPVVRLFGRALGTAGGIGEGEDDGSVVVAACLLDDLLGEEATLT